MAHYILIATNGGTSSAAAVSAGYSLATAHAKSAAWRADPLVRAALSSVREYIFSANAVTKAEALSILSDIARGKTVVERESGTIGDKEYTKTKERRLDERAAIAELAKIMGWSDTEKDITAGSVTIRIGSMED